MKVTIEYDDLDVAKQFNSKEVKEIYELPNNSSTYGDLLDLLRKKFKKTVKPSLRIPLSDERLDHMFNTHPILCEGIHILNMKDKIVDPSKEVLVIRDLELGG